MCCYANSLSACTGATQTIGSADGAEMRLNWKILHTSTPSQKITPLGGKNNHKSTLPYRFPLSPLLGGLKAFIISEIALLNLELLWTFVHPESFLQFPHVFLHLYDTESLKLKHSSGFLSLRHLKKRKNPVKKLRKPPWNPLPRGWICQKGRLVQRKCSFHCDIDDDKPH